jgi:hypothetical protein
MVMNFPPEGFDVLNIFRHGDVNHATRAGTAGCAIRVPANVVEEYESWWTALAAHKQSVVRSSPPVFAGTDNLM